MSEYSKHQPSNTFMSEEQTPPPFRSPITGMPYYSLPDVYPPLPDSKRERDKLFIGARNELVADEGVERVIVQWDVAFIALINRQIQVL
jgi:hypothetical protein